MFKLFCKATIASAFLLTFSTKILTINVKSVLMIHPQLKKSVTLFHEVHTNYLTMVADTQQCNLLSEIYQKQKSFLATLTDKLLNIDPKKGAQTIIITETGANCFGCLIEQEAGAAQEDDSEETLEVFPRMFLCKLFAPGSTVDEKLEIFKKSIQPFNNINTASFVLNNKLRWIAGDRNRTEHDSHLSFTIYKRWDKIINALKSKEELPKQLEELSIANVKKYIDVLHAEFEKSGISDSHHKKIIDIIDDAMATKEIKESDHLAYLHKHLIEDGKANIRDIFNNTMIAFISQKFDDELLKYIYEFEKDSSLNSALIIAGSQHCDEIRNILVAKGYVIIEKAGIEDDNTHGEECLQDKAKLTVLLENIKANSSFVNMAEISA